MQSLPDALAPLAALRQWILYTLHPQADGRVDKLPRSLSLQVIDAHDSNHWTDAATACEAATLNGCGVAFVLTAADPFFALDVDHALQPDGTWSPVAQQLCGAFAGAAIELSQSGTGLHIWGRYAAPFEHGKKNTTWGVELYTSRRFIALTGNMLGAGSADTDHSAALAWAVGAYFPPGAGRGAAGDFTLSEAPVPEWCGPTTDAELLRRALSSRSAAAAFGAAATFRDLWAADADALARMYPGTNGGYDGSQADAALVSHLAFWTGRHGKRIESLMWQSGLVREKWEREDYIPRTIAEILSRPGDVLRDTPVQPGAVIPEGGPVPTSAAVVTSDAKTFFGVEDQRALFAGMTYVIDEDKIYVPGRGMLNQSRFRSVFGGRAFTLDTSNTKTTRNAWEAFNENQTLKHPQADSTCFKPRKPTGELVREPGRALVNIYEPVPVPDTPGDVTPFLRHLALLLPIERDRVILTSYLAACVQYIGIKFQWAPVIQGAEGNGKTLLSRCVAYAVGRRYTHWPKASKLTQPFNGWLVGKLLYAVEDIYVPHGKEDVLEELKPMITGGDGYEIESKGVDQRSVDLCGNFIFNCNRKESLRATIDMRRYAQFFTAQQTAAECVAAGMDNAYFAQLYAWLEADGYAHVTGYLKSYPIPDEFNPAGLCRRAPTTSSTAEAVRAGVGGVEQQIMEAVESGTPGFCAPWISGHQLGLLLERTRITISRRAEMLKTLGYILHPALNGGRVNNPVLPDNKKTQLFVKATAVQATMTDPAAIAKAYTAAQAAG